LNSQCKDDVCDDSKQINWSQAKYGSDERPPTARRSTALSTAAEGLVGEIMHSRPASAKSQKDQQYGNINHVRDEKDVLSLDMNSDVQSSLWMAAPQCETPCLRSEVQRNLINTADSKWVDGDHFANKKPSNQFMTESLVAKLTDDGNEEEDLASYAKRAYCALRDKAIDEAAMQSLSMSMSQSLAAIECDRSRPSSALHVIAEVADDHSQQQLPEFNDDFQLNSRSSPVPLVHSDSWRDRNECLSRPQSSQSLVQVVPVVEQPSLANSSSNQRSSSELIPDLKSPFVGQSTSIAKVFNPSRQELILQQLRTLQSQIDFDRIQSKVSASLCFCGV
jgi:hypothetical protein